MLSLQKSSGSLIYICRGNDAMEHRFFKNRSHYSFRKLLLLLVGVTMCFLVVSILIIFLSWQKAAGRYVHDVGEASLKYYRTSLDNSLSDMDAYCNLSLGNNILSSMKQAEDPLTYMKLSDEIGSTLTGLVQLNNAYFAAAIPGSLVREDAIIRSRCASMEECDRLYDALADQIQQMPATQYQTWHWRRLEGRDYLTNIYRFQDSYCAVLLDTQILSYLADEQTSVHLFCEDNSVWISNNSGIQEALSRKKPEDSTLRLNGKQVMVLTVPAAEGDFSVGMLIGASTTLFWWDLLQPGILLLALLSAVCLMFVWFFHQLTAFFTTLNTACIDIASGNLDTRITRKASMEEEVKLYRAFNYMTRQIKELRISLYEQELATQKSKTRFLRMQIKSHFFVNCLNVIHSLAMVGNMELIQEFTLCLSDYFRYLGSGFSDTVSFGSEMAHLRNYIKLNEIRYPGRIHVEYAIDLETSTFEIIPMIPQTIVENIFKHAMKSNTQVQIHIQAYSAEENGIDGMCLVIRDDGPGFTEEQLRLLNSPNSAEAAPGQGTGIRNTKARMELYYHGTSGIRFENAPDHGAIVKLFFPRTEEQEAAL